MQGEIEYHTKERVTIKDISAKLGISSTTVHRALAGKEGMTDELRDKILQTAREMGYEINYAASCIKRKLQKIAVILPLEEDRYFDNIWKGIRKQAEEARPLNVDVEVFACKDEWDERDILKTIADKGAGEYAGVLAFSYSSSYSRTTEIMMELQRLITMKIPTFMIDDDMVEPAGIYCIPAYQKEIGELAAELTALMTPEEGTVLVSRGREDSTIHREKLQAFQDYLRKHKPGLKIVLIDGYSTKEELDGPVRENIKKALQEHTDVKLYYAQTSGDTRVAAEVFRENKEKCSFVRIGTDLNCYTAESIRKGELTLVIDQGGYRKGYMGLGALVDTVVKHIKPEQKLNITLDVVCQSNLIFYEHTNM